MRLELNCARIEKIELAGSGLERDLDLAALAAIRPILPAIDQHLSRVVEEAEDCLRAE